MKWVQEYVIPALVILAASLLVCAGLWFILTPNSAASTTTNESNNAALTTRPEVAQADGRPEGRLPDLGVLTPVILFIATGLKVALFMGISGIITLRILRFSQRNSREQSTIAAS